MRIIIIQLVVLAIASAALKTKCAEKCVPDECPQIGDCLNTMFDDCECCPICVRQLGESCGRDGEVCDTHLQCHQENDINEVGYCREMQSDNCLNARCPIAFHPRCPDDSRLVILPPPAGECCGKPGTCHCDLQKCAEFVPICDRKSEELKLVSGGADEPGKCCDVFECVKKSKSCENVHCPPRPFDEDAGASDECPPDSFRPPEYITGDACCPMRHACKCRGSICRPAQCADGERVKVLKKGNGTPGRCCDEWKCEPDAMLTKKCMHNGKEYEDGSEWHQSICDVCHCKRGIAICTKMTCPKVSSQCTWIMIPEGECCPVCFGCQTDSLEKKKKHESWQKDDCTTCTCSEEGAHVCVKHMCKTDCENPRKVDGQCCPVCDEPSIVRPPATCPSLEHCSLRCANGLRRDDVGCYVCECVPDATPSDVECDELNEENCDKQCAHGYLKDNHGCAACKCAKCPPLHQCFKHCLYGFESNSAGCPLCKCRASSRVETLGNESDKNKLMSKNGDKCISIRQDGHQVERDGGEWWSDGCRHCFCENGQEFCSLISCPSRPNDCPDEAWQQKDGDCCPQCTVAGMKKKPTTGGAAAAASRQQKHEHTVCQSPGTGRLFTDGETWQLAPCVSCTCRVGHVLCRTSECPPIACANPEYINEDDCCPVCPEKAVMTTKDGNGDVIVCTDESGVAHLVGSSWRQDDCTSCVCTPQGEADCYREACDEHIECRGNPLVIKGKCCPVCSDALSSSAVCSYQSGVYSIGEQWQDGSCSNCSCVAGGQTVCREMVCPHCEDPVTIEGHCCPLCKDVGWAPYGIGNGSYHPSLSTRQNAIDEPSAFPFLMLSAMSLAVVGLLIVLLLLFKRNRKSNKLHKFTEVGQMSSGASTVRLSASKAIGSMPRLFEWNENRPTEGPANHIRHDSQNSDDQTDSLLSTMSDTSTAPSSISSGHCPVSDTQPLTPSRIRRFPV
ncbi:unnamed protein product [Caenorhabditis bovis]|uniref:Uncharacterized protein n=1 Tax=Caenorhabditis bovis TaxID=2654633 RepID=A0A8S1E4K8_9PELO|nr:unnamed protein product [Caenorhabditis bovis]